MATPRRQARGAVTPRLAEILAAMVEAALAAEAAARPAGRATIRLPETPRRRSGTSGQKSAGGAR
jgi:hypothetical protein